jgi:hypothetical protein
MAKIIDLVWCNVACRCQFDSNRSVDGERGVLFVTIFLKKCQRFRVFKTNQHRSHSAYKSTQNIQDKTVISEAIGPLDEDHDGSTIIGHYVTVGQFVESH